MLYSLVINNVNLSIVSQNWGKKIDWAKMFWRKKHLGTLWSNSLYFCSSFSQIISSFFMSKEELSGYQGHIKFVGKHNQFSQCRPCPQTNMTSKSQKKKKNPNLPMLPFSHHTWWEVQCCGGSGFSESPGIRTVLELSTISSLCFAHNS